MKTTLGSGLTQPRSYTTSRVHSFVSAASVPDSDRLVISVGGPEKFGKNHVAFTAPDPIFCQTIDPGTEGVVKKYLKGGSLGLNKDIQLGGGASGYGIEISEDDITDPNKLATAAQPVWEQWVTDYLYALDNARTVVWDTESDAWELIRLARLGELAPKTGRDRGNVWGPVNAEYRRLLRMAFDKNVNMIIIQKLKDVYVNDKKTGNKDHKGFSDVGYIVQMIIRAQRQGNQFSVLVNDCRLRPELNGVTIPSNDFSMIKDFYFGR